MLLRYYVIMLLCSYELMFLRTYVLILHVFDVFRRGAYDLSALDSMEEAFPPRRTTNNIYRDHRYEDEGDRGRGMAETRDSLDRLAGSTSGRRRLTRLVTRLG